jgi:predicted component of viral defense system (DUF524 family)
MDCGTALHLLDAKFRVDRLDALLPLDDETEAERAEERIGTFKRGDLYKMHTYRDAIPQADSVWILYPGTEMRFFDATGGRPVATPELLPHRPMGVGVLPLTPTDELAAPIAAVLRVLLAAS